MRVCKENDMGMVKKIHEISALFAIFEIQKPELGKEFYYLRTSRNTRESFLIVYYMSILNALVLLCDFHPDIPTNWQSKMQFLQFNREGKRGKDLKGDVAPQQVSDRAGSSSSNSSAGERASSLQTCLIEFGKAIKATSAFQGVVLWSAFI